jgi:cation transport ATPase
MTPEELEVQRELEAQEQAKQERLKRMRERFKDYPDAFIEKQIERADHSHADRQVFVDILAERRREAKQADERRYQQTERHHKEAKRLAWTAAVISIIGALASWAGVLIQSHHSSPVRESAPASQLSVTSPTPAAQP